MGHLAFTIASNYTAAEMHLVWPINTHVFFLKKPLMINYSCAASIILIFRNHGIPIKNSLWSLQLLLEDKLQRLQRVTLESCAKEFLLGVKKSFKQNHMLSILDGSY